MDGAVYDAHCHIHETPAALGVLGDSSVQDVVFCVQATQYTDWDDVLRLHARHGERVIPALGLHPWFIERVLSAEIPPTWPTELRRLLEAHGGVLGECGLDKAARNPTTRQPYPFEPQIGVLQTQLSIAHDLGLPVSIHCVRAFGALAEVLRGTEADATLPPRIMLHSYSGSPDMLQQVFLRGELGRRVYVSFSSIVNGRNREKSAQCIRAVPADRLLIESDLHDAAAALPALDEAMALVASARGWTPSETRQQVARNSREFFQL
ncbi:Cut9-interacting protein scn1 [Coemansia sp. RSA 552]|nr:Cut9-interacting protein scn1 [Coemansia sp. RSA 552]